jgi:hypothetical protein
MVKTREAYFAMQLGYTDFFLTVSNKQEKRLLKKKKRKYTRLMEDPKRTIKGIQVVN